VTRLLPLAILITTACATARPPGEHVVRWCSDARYTKSNGENYIQSPLWIHYQLERGVTHDEVLEVEAEFTSAAERLFGLGREDLVKACGQTTVIFSGCEILLDGERLRGLNQGTETLVLGHPGWKRTLIHEWTHRIMREVERRR
jgi:hypothetical protein